MAKKKSTRVLKPSVLVRMWASTRDLFTSLVREHETKTEAIDAAAQLLKKDRKGRS